MYICNYLCMYICMYVCMYVCTCIVSTAYRSWKTVNVAAQKRLAWLNILLKLRYVTHAFTVDDTSVRGCLVKTLIMMVHFDCIIDMLNKNEHSRISQPCFTVLVNKDWMCINSFLQFKQAICQRYGSST